jgi:hypothetical protein
VGTFAREHDKSVMGHRQPRIRRPDLTSRKIWWLYTYNCGLKQNNINILQSG